MIDVSTAMLVSTPAKSPTSSIGWWVRASAIVSEIASHPTAAAASFGRAKYALIATGHA